MRNPQKKRVSFFCCYTGIRPKHHQPRWRGTSQAAGAPRPRRSKLCILRFHPSGESSLTALLLLSPKSLTAFRGPQRRASDSANAVKRAGRPWATTSFSAKRTLPSHSPSVEAAQAVSRCRQWGRPPSRFVREWWIEKCWLRGDSRLGEERRGGKSTICSDSNRPSSAGRTVPCRA